MQIRSCPRCGAPLSPASSDGVESSRFCGVEGRASESDEIAIELVFAVNETIETLCARYVANARAITMSEKCDGVDPDESLLRAIERAAGVSKKDANDFRRQILNFVGALAIEGKKFEATTNTRLEKALTLVLQTPPKAM
jgi:predicted Ser/Thr protein kinase